MWNPCAGYEQLHPSRAGRSQGESDAWCLSLATRIMAATGPVPDTRFVVRILVLHEAWRPEREAMWESFGPRPDPCRA